LAVAQSESALVVVVVGAITRMMPSLVLTPAGTPLVHLGDISGTDLLYDVVFDVALALKHMHTKKVAHNDVSLANVVVVVGSKAVLVDLSLACPFNFEIPFFCGNPVYVHRDVHTDMAWEPRPFHDLAALGFLAAVLASGSIVPWHGLSSLVGRCTTALED
jgi:serine/threonine protein kinase